MKKIIILSFLFISLPSFAGYFIEPGIAWESNKYYYGEKDNKIDEGESNSFSFLTRFGLNFSGFLCSLDAQIKKVHLESDNNIVKYGDGHFTGYDLALSLGYHQFTYDIYFLVSYYFFNYLNSDNYYYSGEYHDASLKGNYGLSFDIGGCLRHTVCLVYSMAAQNYNKLSTNSENHSLGNEDLSIITHGIKLTFPFYFK